MKPIYFKLCVPALESKGLKSRVSDHFGSAPYYVIVNLDTNRSRTYQKIKECDHETHETCMPIKILQKHEVNLVSCKSMGKEAVKRLEKDHIVVYFTDATTVKEAVDNCKNLYLGLLTQDHICKGHFHC